MKSTFVKVPIRLILILFLSIILFNANAQKLPNVQPIGVRAPVNIKTDGKATEWNNKFQAYNKTLDVFYTIANDDEKLYLTIKATDEDMIRKIVVGGITLAINNSGKKKDGVVITFPIYDKKNPPLYLVLNNRPRPTKDTARNRILTDSFMNEYNKQIANRLKIIEVIGVKEIPDSLISIYNEEGIKAVSLFDSQINYTYELSVPLKYLGVNINKSQKFSYNIKMNGLAAGSTNFHTISSSKGEMTEWTGADGVNYTNGLVTPQNMNLIIATDFWGEYTLAKN